MRRSGGCAFRVSERRRMKAEQSENSVSTGNYRPRFAPRGGRCRRPRLPGRRRSRQRQDDAGTAVPSRGHAHGEKVLLRHAFRNEVGARGRRGVARLGARRHGDPRAGARPTKRASSPTINTRSSIPSEVELGETTQAVLSEVERVQPDARGLRLAVRDAAARARAAALPPADSRPEAVLRRAATARCCCSTTGPRADGDLQLQSLAHGVITLEQLAPEYGAERRRLRVVKLRGVKFQGGFHDFVIATGGLRRVSAAGRRRASPRLTQPRHRQHRHRGARSRSSAAGSIAARRRC